MASLRRVLHRCLAPAALALACSGIALGAARPSPPAPIVQRPAPGKLLVAAPSLNDPNFAETVVLLVRYGERSALGLIVNRPMDLALHRLLPDAPLGRHAEDRVFLGGPVGMDRLSVAIRGTESIAGAVRVLPAVHVSADADVLAALLRREDDAFANGASFRAYVGYAGWGAGQLDREILRGDWLLVDGDAQTVFSHEPAKLWRRLLRGRAGTWVRGPARDASKNESCSYNGMAVTVTGRVHGLWEAEVSHGVGRSDGCRPGGTAVRGSRCGRCAALSW